MKVCLNNPVRFFAGDILDLSDDAGRAMVESGEGEEVKDDSGAASVTPAAQTHADNLGVDLSQVEGSGTDGQILKADVTAASETEAHKAASA